MSCRFFGLEWAELGVKWGGTVAEVREVAGSTTSPRGEQVEHLLGELARLDSDIALHTEVSRF